MDFNSIRCNGNYIYLRWSFDNILIKLGNPIPLHQPIEKYTGNEDACAVIEISNSKHTIGVISI